MKINKELKYDYGYEVLSEESTNIVATRTRDIVTGTVVTLDAEESGVFIPVSPYAQTSRICSGQAIVVHYINSSPKHIPVREGAVVGHILISANPTSKILQNTKVSTTNNKPVNIETKINKVVSK